MHSLFYMFNILAQIDSLTPDFSGLPARTQIYRVFEVGLAIGMIVLAACFFFLVVKVGKHFVSDHADGSLGRHITGLIVVAFLLGIIARGTSAISVWTNWISAA